jgi:hypothetical protein
VYVITTLFISSFGPFHTLLRHITSASRFLRFAYTIGEQDPPWVLFAMRVANCNALIAA